MKVLIVEDEELAANRLKKLILGLRPSYQILDILESVGGVVKWMQETPVLPDLILMDIQLSDGVSFEIFDSIEIKTPIIFTTAYDQYAIKAFKFNSIDYLLKPIKIDELMAAMIKFEQSPVMRDYKMLKSNMLESSGSPRRFVIKIGGTIRTINFEDVAYIFTTDKITFAMTFDGKRYPLDQNLEQIEEFLDPTKFFRVNRQFIVQFKSIVEIHTHSKSRIKLILNPKTEQELIISTEKSSDFKTWLSGTK